MSNNTMFRDGSPNCGSCMSANTFIDNDDCRVSINYIFTTKQEANDELTTLSAKATKIQSEPCIINSTINETEQGFELIASFDFCCQAEALLFQM